MKREDLEALRAKVSCEAALENAGYEIDHKQSTRRAVKYRHGSNIAIVTHDGRGWFDPLSDNKGDVFELVMFLERIPFPTAVDMIASLVGFEPSRLQCKASHPKQQIKGIVERWQSRRAPSRGSSAWHYLCSVRKIPTAIALTAIQAGVLREGPCGSIWAAHLDNECRTVGWEERGPEWRGFSKGGSKVLFRIGSSRASRLCVTEAAVDALSLAALEGLRDQTLYVSTGGGWSPATEAALNVIASRPGCQIIAATDSDPQGDVYAERLRLIAQSTGSDWQRLRPPADDWNDVLQNMKDSKAKKKLGPPASREASSDRRPSLTRPDTTSATREGC
jgi:hypothetical protein